MLNKHYTNITHAQALTPNKHAHTDPHTHISTYLHFVQWEYQVMK